MMTSLKQSINKISQVDQNLAQIDKQEPKNKCVDNTRSMIDSLLTIDKNISQGELINPTRPGGRG